MKQHTFSKKSWHYRLATVYGFMEIHNTVQVTICEYVKEVGKGFLMMLAVIITLGAITACFADLGAWIVAGLVTGTFVMLNLTGGIAVSFVLAITFLSMLKLITRYIT